MKQWKIARIKIENFKPFEEACFDLESSSLITLDGPNGFGKTSIFDAVELLFTGYIKRVIERNINTIAKGKKKNNFEENLYWNKKKLGDLVIRVELTSDEGRESLFLARVALTSELISKENNAPDNFSIFKLYQLDSFESDDFKNRVSDTLFEDFLGVNFLKNFSLLNYLEQGENRYLHSTNANERKKGIEHLINTDKLTEQIQFFKSLESQISDDYVGKKHTDKLVELKLELNNLNSQISDSSIDNKYKRLSSSTQIPKWDVQNPITTPDQEALEKLIEDVKSVSKVCSNLSELKVRKSNDKLSDLLSKENDIKSALSIGSFIDKYESLKSTYKALNQLDKNSTIFEISTDKITNNDIAKLVGEFDTKSLEVLINNREKKKLLSDAGSQKLLNLLEAKKELLKQYKQCSNENELNCPFCNLPWDTKKLLEESAQIAIDLVSQNIDDHGIELEKINDSIKLDMKSKISNLILKRELLLLEFNKPLYKKLEKAFVKFDGLKSIIKELGEYQVFPSKIYDDSELTVDNLLDEAKEKLGKAKKAETDTLPSNWKNIISSTFTKEDDMKAILAEDFENKIAYLLEQQSQLKHKQYQNKKTEIENLTKKIESGKKIKKKIVSSRKIIESTVEQYTKKMIGDIELLFHIYSGRLIQNYQRGLGLFLTSADGKTLKFSTVEHSEHDAILSLSSGQVAALGMAFFLTLNKVYASNSFVLIDDPVQSMDEINVASLCDLFRVEFQDRQILISNHEESISNFIRYKYKRAGLSQLPINMLEINNNESQTAESEV
jgi:exonuclease SbcC